MKKGKNNIDTGKLLNDFFKKNHIIKGDLGKKISRNGQSIINYGKKDSIQTGILIELCYALEHNFLLEMANQLPKHFLPKPIHEVETEKLIAEMKEEIKILKVQNELLMKIKA